MDKPFEIGEIVHVKGRVTQTSDGVAADAAAILVEFGGNDVSWVPVKDIMRREPPPLKVGERVRANNQNGDLLAISGPYAWVGWDCSDGTMRLRTEQVAGLERI